MVSDRCFPFFTVELDSVYFVTCPDERLEMDAIVLHRVAFLEYFCPKQRVRISNPWRHPYTQTWVKYPPDYLTIWHVLHDYQKVLLVDV